MTIPSFNAEASLGTAAGHYRSRSSGPGGRHSAGAQKPVAAAAGCCWMTCRKNREGHWECECAEECWE